MSTTVAPRLHHMESRTQPVVALIRKLRSSVRTGRKLHLDTEEIAVLLRPEIYELISRLEAEEMRKACALNADNDNTSWAASGCGSDPTPERGASAGLSATATGATSRGARLRLSEAMSEVRHRSRL
jgi:hypothetical protein